MPRCSRPGRRRDALYALYAFNLETAKTAEVVSEPLLGEIRLQWWRDAIDGIYEGSVREHPVLAALAEAIGTWGLERSRFHAILDGRAADLRDRPFDDLDALEKYVVETAVPLIELACQALGAEDEGNMRLAREAGLGLGLAGVLRAIPVSCPTTTALRPPVAADRSGDRARRAFLTVPRRNPSPRP